MNHIPQLDFHPDAEVLSAFAEQALPEGERAQILGHIAGCMRCRQILYLAQEAANEMKAATFPAARVVFKEKTPKFWSWRLAWAPAAGFAALAAVAITLYFRPGPQPAELAKAAPQGLEAIAHSTQPLPPSMEKKSGVALPGAAKQAPANPAPEGYTPPPGAVAGAPFAASSSSDVGTSRLSSAQPETGQRPQGGAGQESTQQAPPPQTNPQTAVAAWQQEQQRAVEALSSRAEAAARATQMKMRSAADRMVASRAPSYSTAGVQMEPKAAPSGNFDSGSAPAIHGLTMAPNGPPAKSPRDFTAISTVTAQQRILAIDQTGTLHVSEDSGKSWESVARQWTGKAVQIRLQQRSSGPGATAAGGNPGRDHGAAPLSAAPGYEIVNDAGLVWTSRDGRAWRAQ
jgi:hypothetical protein